MTPPLEDVLAEAQRLGFLGPGPVQRHVQHAHGYLVGLDEVRSLEVVVDLGSGGGVPGLVIACQRPAWTTVLVERMQKRADWLRRAVARLGVSGHATVQATDAQTYATSHRAAADAVTARSFGRPGVLAECVAPLLRVGGVLVVSDVEPASTDDTSRWSAGGLAELGMALTRSWNEGGWPFVAITQVEPCPPRFPRASAAVERRPLF